MVIKKAGFTLIEILIVVILLGSIAAMVGPNIMKRLGKGRIGTTKLTLNGLKSALEEYKMDVGSYPDKRAGGLDALVNKPNVKGAERYNGPYLNAQEIPVDAWGNEFIYNTPPVRFKNKFKAYEIYSEGDPSEENSAENPDLHVGS